MVEEKAASRDCLLIYLIFYSLCYQRSKNQFYEIGQAASRNLHEMFAYEIKKYVYPCENRFKSGLVSQIHVNALELRFVFFEKNNCSRSSQLTIINTHLFVSSSFITIGYYSLPTFFLSLIDSKHTRRLWLLWKTY